MVQKEKGGREEKKRGVHHLIIKGGWRRKGGRGVVNNKDLKKGLLSK